MKLPLKICYDYVVENDPVIVDADGAPIAFGCESEGSLEDLEEIVRRVNLTHSEEVDVSPVLVEPEDRSKFPRCPECWTNGHEHRKTCRYRDDGMVHHVRPK
jgi:hypothetical protein